MSIQIYTDGGCSGNPGPGAWAAILLLEDSQIRISGFEPKTTNNRMELTAVLKALEELNQKGPIDKPIELYTDSQYVWKGFTEWITNWKKKNWKNSEGEPVKNRELWENIVFLSKNFKINWYWIKGHSTNTFNQECDLMVQRELKRFK